VQIELLVAPRRISRSIPEGAALAQAATLPMNALTAKLGLELSASGGRRHARSVYVGQCARRHRLDRLPLPGFEAAGESGQWAFPLDTLVLEPLADRSEPLGTGGAPSRGGGLGRRAVAVGALRMQRPP
jgi:hypothetical protein